jgi:hypothetical protein
MRGSPNVLLCWGRSRRHMMMGGQFVVLLCLAMGCAVAPLQIEREDDLVDLLGVHAVQEEMADVLARTYNPTVQTVRFRPDRMMITFSLENADKTYLDGEQASLELVYGQIEKLAPYTNGRVFVDHLAGYTTQLNFRHPDDAATFAKLFYTLQTHAKR